MREWRPPVKRVARASGVGFAWASARAETMAETLAETLGGRGRNVVGGEVEVTDARGRTALPPLPALRA